MQMSTHEWISVPQKGSSEPSSINPAHFTLSCAPKTDIWRPSRTEDVFSAPFIYTAVHSKSFQRASVTVLSTRPWKTLYDQGGLFIVWPRGADQDPSKANQRRWLKAGIEVFDGKASLSVVGTDRFSDWSLSPLSVEAGGKARVLAERDGSTLWVYYLDDAGKKTALREIKWAFVDEEGVEGDMWVGVAVAKPTPDQDDEKAQLTVEFHDLKVEA